MHEQAESPACILCSNDYLGIGSNPAFWKAFLEQEYTLLQTDSYGFAGGACSSRLLTGNDTVCEEIEAFLVHAFRMEAALVLNSGYHANIGILPALTTRKDLIVADKLVHASLIDGMRLSQATVLRYPHLDMQTLEHLLQRERHKYDQVFLVTESLFSMDGDIADLKALVALKHQYQCMLYVDEAHSFGVRGPGGLGCAQEQDVLHEVDLLLGTFGKAAASQGAFVMTRSEIRDYLVNTMRPLIFTTALPPWSLRWTRYVLGLIGSMSDERAHLAHSADMLREQLAQTGLETSGNSHIIPIFIRDAHKAILCSEQLRAQGFHVLPIRPPTVPEGTERLRISLTAAHKEAQINSFAQACRNIG
jgi:8-amino-7-oxononanoate synthase